PHVFQSGEDLTPEAVIQRWNDLKVVEKREKARLSHRMEEASGFGSPVQAALQIQKEAARVGFDFPNRREVVSKLVEESREMLAACEAKSRDDLDHELGDMLFSLVNVARLHEIDLEQSLRNTNAKFIRRFRLVEDEVEKRGGFNGKSLTELDDIWNVVKAQEKTLK
ncbi:MAG TPA: MazG nucleotide pyrophosphohydrolase domain-containing protein, partial [Candidatus Ozemobacteraceae bacterium]|nr:MazG nucleotide pyrophosphohydrolase domain-containing protein [Candidatus Ozemobacteraceae bacterium]